jgi:hypothetical protein
MNVRIRGGTVNHSEPSLCLSCRHSIIVKGAALRDEIVACNLIRLKGRVIPFPVTSCTGYQDRGQPTLWHMEEIAWVLRSDPKRRTVGFVEARKLKDDDKHVLEEV